MCCLQGGVGSWQRHERCGAGNEVCAPPCSFVSDRCRLTLPPSLEYIDDKSSLDPARLFDSSCRPSSSWRLAEPGKHCDDSEYIGKAAAIPSRAAAALCSSSSSPECMPTASASTWLSAGGGCSDGKSRMVMQAAEVRKACAPTQIGRPEPIDRKMAAPDGWPSGCKCRVTSGFVKPRR